MISAMDRATEDAKRVLILCKLDGYANGLKPVAVQRYLLERGHNVSLVSTYHLGRASSAPGSLGRKLPRPGLRRLALYTVEAASALLTRRWTFGRRRLSFYLLVGAYRLRRSLLKSLLPLDDFDLIICEHPDDAGVLTVGTSARTLYDCPTPWADELFFEDRLTQRQHQKLRRLEAELFESVDALSFSWQTYAPYAVDHYGISGRNFLQLNWGCRPAQRAKFNAPPRVVFMSSLSSKFIDLPLLSRLSKLYPHIDVYGGPPPDPALGLNYLGYASPTVLQQYQFGLITCNPNDELRRDGFSAKHLDYIAHGLPVLVPVWRRHMELIRGSVAYDEETFVSVIRALSNEGEWQRVSDEAYAQAQRLTWDQTLRPVDTLLGA
jgi:hypothetical protein